MQDLAIRASSLGDLTDCPARWYAKNIEGRRTPSGPAALIGTALHASTAAFDQSRIDGSGLSIDDTAGVAVDRILNPEGEVDWTQDDSWAPKSAEVVALSLHARYCAEIGSRRVYRNVEADLGEVKVIVPEADVVVTLSGHSDRIREHDDGRLGVADLKSGARIVNANGTVTTKGNAYQLAQYALLHRVNRGEPLTAPAEIIGLNTGKTPAAQRIAVGYCDDIETTLLGTDDAPGLIQIAAQMAKADTFFGNPRSMLCSAKYCPAWTTCRWRR